MKKLVVLVGLFLICSTPNVFAADMCCCYMPVTGEIVCIDFACDKDLSAMGCLGSSAVIRPIGATKLSSQAQLLQKIRAATLTKAVAAPVAAPKSSK